MSEPGKPSEQSEPDKPDIPLTKKAMLGLLELALQGLRKRRKLPPPVHYPKGLELPEEAAKGKEKPPTKSE